MPTSRSLFRISLAPVVHALGRVRRRLVETVVALWELVGSNQMRNLLLAVGLVLAVWLAQRIERCERDLGRVAEAQGVMGYATMRQLEALGLGPKEGAGAPAPTAPPRAVDPATLDAQPSAPGVRPGTLPTSVPTTPAHEDPR